MGFTWTILIVYTYLWQFHSMTFLVGSRKAEEVDKLEDMDTLLPKCRWLIDKQPKWLRPKGFDKEKHASWMNILNPETQGSITGESNNPSFGTGGRKNSAFLDEFSKWEHTDSQAWTSVGQTTPCRIAGSTPLFKNNRFFVLKSEPIKNLATHWSEHPIKAAGLHEIENVEGELIKTSPWYEIQKLRYRPDEIAQELDISYSGTQTSTVYFDELQLMRVEKRIRKIDYMPNLPIYWAFDPGIGDIWANGFFQILGYAEEIRWFEYYENQNLGIDHYIDWVKHETRPWNKRQQDRDAGGVNYVNGWQDMSVIPDPNQGTNREAGSGKSLKTQLSEAGFKKVFIVHIGKIEAIGEAKRVFKKLWMDDGSNSKGMIQALDRMSSYHHKWNENRQEYDQEPVHDASSHCADQFKYFAAWLKNPEKMKTQVERVKEQREKELKPQPTYADVPMAGI